MIKRAVLILLGLIGLSQSVTPTVVYIAPVDDRFVTKILKSNRARFERMTVDSTGILAVSLLSDSGYLGASYQIDTAGRVEVTAGDRSILRKVAIDGDTTAEFSSTAPFTERAVTDLVQPILASFQSRGYYYASAQVSPVSINGDSVDLVATMRKGPLVTISDLKCDGLRRTSNKVVQRSLGIVSGEPMTSSKIEEIDRRARQIPFLIYLPPVEIEPQPGYNSAAVRLRFREPSMLSASGTGGYRPDDKNGVVWSFDGRLRDLFGAGRTLRLLSERRDKDNRILNIEYAQPSFLFGRGQFDALLRSRDLRSQFSEFAISAGLSTYVSDQSLLGGTVGWSRVDPADSTFGYNKYSAGVRYDLNARYDSLSPVSGYRLSWSADYQLRVERNSVDSVTVRRISKNESRSRLTLETALPLHTPFWVATTRLDLMALFTEQSNPPLAELFLLGGPGSIRGYRTDQFGARRAAIGSTEIHLRGKQGYLFLFGDVGYLYSPLADGESDESTRFGYGAGFRLYDRDRMVEVALGWNPDLRLNRPQLILKLATGL